MITGRVHDEECDRSFSVFLFRKQRMVLFFFFLVEKRTERRELVKRKIENLEKALEKVIFKKC